MVQGLPFSHILSMFKWVPFKALFFMFFLDFELPLASIWVPMGSLFGIVFSTLFLNVKMAQDGPLPPPKWEVCGGGAALWHCGNIAF